MDVAWNAEAGVTDGDGKGCDQSQNNDSAVGFFCLSGLVLPTAFKWLWGKHVITDLRPAQLRPTAGHGRGRGTTEGSRFSRLSNIPPLLSYDFCPAS